MRIRSRSAVCAALGSWLVAQSAGAQAPVPVSISGLPGFYVEVWQFYGFEPQATVGPEAPPIFSIENPPAWASFNTVAGVLSGTPSPSDVGIYANITISVTDGVTTAVLQPFSIVVEPAPNSQALTLSWAPPTQNEDGSALTNLVGYRIYLGPAADELQPLIELNNATATSYAFTGLAPGQYYFALTSVNAVGVESALSMSVPATIN
jgi:hypothetical protein